MHTLPKCGRRDHVRTLTDHSWNCEIVLGRPSGYVPLGSEFPERSADLLGALVASHGAPDREPTSYQQ